MCGSLVLVKPTKSTEISLDLTCQLGNFMDVKILNQSEPAMHGEAGFRSHQSAYPGNAFSSLSRPPKAWDAHGITSVGIAGMTDF